MPIQCSDRAEGQQQRDKEIVTPQSACVCVALAAVMTAGLASINVPQWIRPPTTTGERTHARVCQCVPLLLLLAFYLGTASEQFTACQSSCRSERQQQDEGKEGREERLTTVGGVGWR